MDRITVLNGQSIFDIAVQYGGSIEAVFDIAKALGVSITDELTIDSGQLMIVDVLDRSVTDYFRTHRLFPATGVNNGMNPLVSEGIEFWAIEYDFSITN